MAYKFALVHLDVHMSINLSIINKIVLIITKNVNQLELWNFL